MTNAASHVLHGDSQQHLMPVVDRNTNSGSGSPYKRAYKACESCRKTKAKCELDPSATACSKCLREQKECIFPAYRSAKRAKVSANESTTNEVDKIHSVTIKNDGVRRLSRAVGRAERIAHTAQGHTPRTNGRLDSQQDAVNSTLQTDQTASSSSSANPAETVSPRQEALASGSEGQDNTASINPTGPEIGLPADIQHDVVMQTVVTNSKDAIGLLFRAAEQIDSEDSDELLVDQDMLNDASAVPASIYNIQSPSMPSPGLPSSEILDLWDQHRFVRQGWFTAREAVSYIEFFFRNLSPLSPVADSYYADHKNHKRLILEEPLLCCTLLMIASRHHVPTSGSLSSRADFIHMRLWRHVEHLIQKITFGMEKYSVGKTRTLGSIQALLLIIEWHPRALHFPPETDGWDSSLAPSVDDSYQTQNRKSDAGRRWREDVFEPAKRSDRMSWMLVGIAMTLAHELGVFDHHEEDDGNSEMLAKRKTVLRTRRLLFLYASQLSLRLGCTNIFPQVNHQTITYIPEQGISLEEQVNIDREIMISKWIEITKLLTTAMEMFFASPSSTRQMLRSSRYVSLLDHFQPLLDRWYSDFASTSPSTIAEPAREILLVDYHYVRMYINSIAIQALVERASSYNSGDIWLDQDFLRSEFAQDFRFVKEVRESSASILNVATKLAKDNLLQYCPVRLFLRIVSASIFLLKTVSLGSREADIAKSLGQLERCIEALQTSRADDVHLSSRYAMLIARHVRRFKRNFRIRKPGVSQSESVMRSYTTVPPSTSLQQTVRDEQPTQMQQPNVFGVNNDELSEKSGLFTAPFFDFDDGGMMQDWLAQPFNSQVAPFGTDWLQPASGLAIDSLDFLWNMSA